MLRIITLAILILCGTVHGTLAQSTIPPNSTWMNGRGSILTIINIAGDGTFDGTYVNKAAGTFCMDYPYLVEGKIKDDTIRFEVAFADSKDSTKNCFTVTEWRGTFSANVIDTNWSLAYPGPAGLILIGGADKFDLQP
jgi:hypothetical protein